MGSQNSTTASESRPQQLTALYRAFSKLNDEIDGPYYLENYSSDLDYPQRGIYIFFTPSSDLEHDHHSSWSVARIGTVGVAEGSTNTLAKRLRQHRGNENGRYAENGHGGNHRGSIFRLHVGKSFIIRDGLNYPLWGKRRSQWPEDADTASVRKQETPLEQRVSKYIRDHPYLVLNVPGTPGPKCDRAIIEKELIATFGFYHRQYDTIRDSTWLGTHNPQKEIYKSGLWNIDGVEGFPAPSVVNKVEKYTEQTTPLDG